ncbi:MAG: IMP cyclohydrolase [Psychromonas sp.]
MYVGRIVAAGLTEKGKFCVMYRVSSRTFPNRIIKENNGALFVMPKSGFESDIFKNPYISYNCLHSNQRYAVVGNGTHTDPIFEKLKEGMSMRDSIASVLLTMDYKQSTLDTPRISAIVDKKLRRAALGVVRENVIEVHVFDLQPGRYRYVTTYEHCVLFPNFGGDKLVVSSAEEAAQYILSDGVFQSFNNPISAAAAIESENGFILAHQNLNSSNEQAM